MPIIGFNLKSIEAEKKKEPQGKLNISNNPKITNVESTEVNIGGKQASKALRMEYEVEINYEPKTGSIRFTGDLIFVYPDQDAILKQWKKDKKLPDVILVEIINFLFRKLITKALVLSDDLQLPPSIPYPTASITQPTEQKNPKYIE